MSGPKVMSKNICKLYWQIHTIVFIVANLKIIETHEAALTCRLKIFWHSTLMEY